MGQDSLDRVGPDLVSNPNPLTPSGTVRSSGLSIYCEEHWESTYDLN